MESYSKRVVDKISFRIPKSFLNIDEDNKHDFFGKGGELIEGCNLINKCQYYYVMAHDVEIEDDETIIDVVSERFMRLYNCENPLFKEKPTVGFLYVYGVISELEIAFDFYGEPPFEIRDSELWNVSHKTTYYTASDYRVYYDRDGNRDKIQTSFLKLYDRSGKIGSEEKITRLEYSFYGKYMWNKILPTDLYMRFGDIYKSKLYPIIVKNTKKLLTKDMIRFYKKKLMSISSDFYGILLNSGWYSK